MQYSKVILLVTGMLVIGFGLSGCSNNNIRSAAQVSSVKSEKAQIVGSYRDDADGAAVTFNGDGTGTYVMANPASADVRDQLTWKKEKGNYIINLNDSNCDTPINAHLNEDNLSLVGNNEWTNQSFSRVHGEFNIDNFLNEQHAKGDISSSQDTQNIESSTDARIILKEWARDHNQNTETIDQLKATTDLNAPDEGWAFVDNDGNEYAIVRNGKVYPCVNNSNSSSN